VIFEDLFDGDFKTQGNVDFGNYAKEKIQND
jgi:hypothetical protein